MAELSKKNLQADSRESDVIYWHTLPSDEVFSRLASTSRGLDKSVAEKRLQQSGLNRLQTEQVHSPLRRFFQQFHNMLIYVLLIAGVITLFLGHWIDSGVIFAVVLINAIIGFIQEGKAQKALDAIRNMLTQQALVRRNGSLQTINTEMLVPGDVVLLQSGDRVPADLRLFKSRQLRIDESLLTGESVAIEKFDKISAPDTVLAERYGMAYSGTLVTYGQGAGVVVATGNDTEVGRISNLLRTVTPLTTPLLRKIAAFARWLTAAILLMAGLTFVFGVLVKGYSAGEMFLAAVGLAVAAIPEGLPAIMTITLAIGVQRMAQRNAIIRRLPAVETLGSVTVICSDKTGTLTRNAMTAKTVVTATDTYAVSGGGYDPHGEFSIAGQTIDVENHPVLLELSRGAMLCNDAKLQFIDEDWQLQGDPTEGALMVLGMKAGLNVGFQNEEWPRDDVIPFESEHRFMATLHHDHAGHGFIYLKGATEDILSMASYQRMRGEDVPLDTVYWYECMHKMAESGQRVLAIAFKTTGADHHELQFSDVNGGLTLLGLIGIIDPPREEAIEAIQRCGSAGINVKMITGDHAVTALAIARQMGLGKNDLQAVTGTELNKIDDESLRELVRQADVFARASPEQKLRLVKALQANGEVVAMTGDGVNDAPALKRADVGMAMGRKGTEVAKEAAEMVLADDNFASITKAVEEGRLVYDNLKKAILFILPTNGGEALTLITAIVLGRMLPITAAQILWINMITAVTLALALAFEPAEGDVMARPPRQVDEPVFSPFLIWRILFVSVLLASGTFGLFIWERLQGVGIDHARTLAVNALVMFEIFYLFNARFLLRNSFTLQTLFSNRYVMIAIATLLIFQVLFTYWPPMQQIFATAALSIDEWGKIVLVASSVLFVVELEKWLIRCWLRRQPPVQ